MFSKQMDGYVFAITKVRMPRGQEPYDLLQSQQQEDRRHCAPKDMTRLAILIADPLSPIISVQLRDNIYGASTKAVVSGDGYMYTFSTPLPADAKGTFIFGMEGYKYKR